MPIEKAQVPEADLQAMRDAKPSQILVNTGKATKVAVGRTIMPDDYYTGYDPKKKEYVRASE